MQLEEKQKQKQKCGLCGI